MNVSSASSIQNCRPQLYYSIISTFYLNTSTQTHWTWLEKNCVCKYYQDDHDSATRAFVDKSCAEFRDANIDAFEKVCGDEIRRLHDELEEGEIMYHDHGRVEGMEMVENAVKTISQLQDEREEKIDAEYRHYSDHREMWR